MVIGSWEDLKSLSHGFRILGGDSDASEQCAGPDDKHRSEAACLFQVAPAILALRRIRTSLRQPATRRSSRCE